MSSGLKMYSFGIVALDKARDSEYAKIVPIEHITIVDGVSETVTASGSGKIERKTGPGGKPLSNQTSSYSVNIPDHQGVNRDESLSGDIMIVAKWIAIGQSNRVTAPDVIAGETVMLYQMSDTDEYRWTTLLHEPSIRRQETVCYMFGNIPNGQVPMDKDHSYWIEFSTHDKYVKLHTSKNDTEPFAYDFTLDTANGSFTVTDDVGNSIVLDSSQNKITFNTLDTIEANTKKVVINADTSVDITSPITTVHGDFHVTGKSNLDEIVVTGADVDIGGGMSTGASGSGGAASIAGPVTAKSTMSVEGGIDTPGPIKGASLVTDGNISAGGSIHGTNI